MRDSRLEAYLHGNLHCEDCGSEAECDERRIRPKHGGIRDFLKKHAAVSGVADVSVWASRRDLVGLLANLGNKMGRSSVS
jgi:hypothetical protein